MSLLLILPKRGELHKRDTRKRAVITGIEHQLGHMPFIFSQVYVSDRKRDGFDFIWFALIVACWCHLMDMLEGLVREWWSQSESWKTQTSPLLGILNGLKHMKPSMSTEFSVTLFLYSICCLFVHVIRMSHTCLNKCIISVRVSLFNNHVT